MHELLDWLENSALGSVARESLYGFQILVAIHILGLVFSVGMLLWVDLRMIGVCLSDYRLSTVYRTLSRWFGVGFSIMMVSGIALFAGFATSAFENLFFRVKIAAIALAGINAVAFHRLSRHISETADLATRPPRFVRWAGLTSILLWAAVILCGRMMSYTLF
jgi:Family of unknown function (DUF6644)